MRARLTEGGHAAKAAGHRLKEVMGGRCATAVRRIRVDRAHQLARASLPVLLTIFRRDRGELYDVAFNRIGLGFTAITQLNSGAPA